MKSTSVRILFAAALAVSAACGGDEIGLGNQDTGGGGSDAGNEDQGGGGNDTGEEDLGADADTSGGDDISEDTGGEDPWAFFPSLFEECEGDGECGAGQICWDSVCVREPSEDATMFEESGGAYNPIDGPDLSCWNGEPIVPATDTPETVRMAGSVDLFGPESPTNNLCITIFNQELYLRWMVWLNENVCGQYLDVDPRDQEPYVNCFALDPCRCEDEEFTANRGNAADSINSCYAEIGFCDGIEGDSSALETCRANILARTGIAADTMIYGSTTSTPYPENPSRTEGVYEVEGIPTNTYLVSKVGGRLSRWRDTYEHGVFLRADEAEDGAVGWSTNVITDGAWRTIPQSAGVPDPIPAEGTAIAGIVRDCSGNTSAAVRGAQVGIVNDPVQLAYFNGVSGDNLPQPGQAFTNRDGVYAAINAPAGPNRVTVVVEDGGERLSAGHHDVYAPPQSVAIATFEGVYVPRDADSDEE
jgi:hypothetical protein